MTDPLRIVIKTLPEVLVASLRFEGQYADIPAAFERLQAAAAPFASGEPFCLYDHTADEHPEQAHMLEVCLPVSQVVEDGEVHSHLLAGCQALSLTTDLPADIPWGPGGWWRELGNSIRSHKVTIDEDPFREARRATPAGLQAELQAVLQFPRWLESLAAGAERQGGAALRQQVMAGSENLAADSPIQERIAWVQGAMQRLDAGLDDPFARCRILNGCAHRFPPTRIEQMRREYARLGDIDALLEVMRADRSVGGLSWYGNPVREGNIIYEVKDPPSPESYEKAASEREKRSERCYCPIGKVAILEETPISATFCNCGAGWYVTLWEGILGKPVRVEVLESALQGDERCRFAIHLPEGV
jgi:hypothetical protein